MRFGFYFRVLLPCAVKVAIRFTSPGFCNINFVTLPVSVHPCVRASVCGCERLHCACVCW
jgi:hypothetical protein